ncbi:type III secretion system export apparatus subunit SctT [Chromobacterium piscinae]|uniref:type III secretion system export apparatus subunit SctT n=1 Tax=Chromobacterium piscinae TaxID=686831 RepID=UPI001E57F6F0|nr:type III secretion system export apparatus subunit SctT [Chromobacterium piscinae]MCD5330845.1 type III secretion system export apparatus subunit SctT [Chromobacterium piscinae]
MDSLNPWWPLLGAAMMRPLGAMLLLPLFSPSMLGSALIRNALALMATLPALPLLAPLALPDPIQAPAAYALLLASELAVGLLLGFSAAIPFWAVDMAGFALDTLRGASMAGVLNPLIGGQSSPMGALFSQLAAVLFMALGGFHAFLSALYASYQQLPPGMGWHWSSQFIPLLQRQWQLLYTLGLGFAMPALVMMVLVDLALGLINRSVQQLNVFSLSMPIKSLVALLMLIIGLQFGLSDVIAGFERFDGGLARVLEPGR